MQTVSDQTATRRVRPRRRLRTTTIIMGAALALVSLAAMLYVLVGFFVGYWPPKNGQETGGLTPGVQAMATHEAQAAFLTARGLTLEKAGAARKEGEQIVVPVKVTNNLKLSAAAADATSPTPTAGPANLINGTIKVLFYKVSNGSKQLVGVAYGNVVDLQYGQSKQIDVVATGVGDYDDYEIVPDSVWTDKDATKVPAGSSPSPSPGSP